MTMAKNDNQQHPARSRSTPLAWVGLVAGGPGWWLGRTAAEAVGWSPFGLPGALTQMAGMLLLAFAGFMAIRLFYSPRPPDKSENSQGGELHGQLDRNQ
jgi:hypothetical protein